MFLAKLAGFLLLALMCAGPEENNNDDDSKNKNEYMGKRKE